MAQERRAAPSSSSNQAHITGFRSRRGSLASLHSTAAAAAAAVDREALAQALDDIHTTASKSEALTSFSDFEGRGNRGKPPGTKELVTGGISGLYTRLKQSVGAGSGSPTSDQASGRPFSRSSHALTDTASVKSYSSTALRNSFSLDNSRALSVGGVAGAATAAAATAAAPLTSSPSLHARSAHHVSRSSLTLPESSSLASRSTLDISSSPVISGAELVPTPLSRAHDISHSRPGSRDIHRSALANLSEGTVVLPATIATRRDAANRASLTLPFREDTPMLSDDEHDAVLSPMPGSSAVQTPLEQMTNPLSRINSIADKSARRRSQGTPQAEQPTSAVNVDILSPRLESVQGSAKDQSQNQRPALRISPSHLPNMPISESSSTNGTNTLTTNSRVTTPLLDSSPNFNAAAAFSSRRPGPRQMQDPNSRNTVIPAHLKRRVISKEFWMKDENARDCFCCGDAFSTFRRKHHCRTCGQIFDSKCTTLVSGRPFGQPGTLRLCKPCEGIIYGSDDDSTVFTDEETDPRSPEMGPDQEEAARFKPDEAALAAPSIGIPVSKRNREAKRRSAVIEFDQPMLARPSSSRSLKSLSGRPRSSSHKRFNSRQQQWRTLKNTPEERGPFYGEAADVERRVPLPAFHNDNIIDPDLAAYLSDDASEDDQPNIFATLNGDIPGTSPADSERIGLTGLLSSAVRKGRSRRGDRSTAGQSLRDGDGPPLPNKHLPRLSRKRNPSIGSIGYSSRPSPRRSRSTNLLKAFDADGGTMSPLIFEANALDNESDPQVKRSAAMHGKNAPAIELNSASLQHVRRLLAQLLKDAKLPHRKHWEKALMPILLQCTDDVDPDVQNGDDMDIRNYIKLKKIPGGKPGDTAYISGVVFSKNIALKSMRRTFVRPRIAIVTFAIEYARHNQHFMSLEPVIAQEREYLRNLVGRIVALKPQILLVQRNVSGLALEMLQKEGITVVYNIKDSVLAAVARVTKTVLIKSVDKLSIDPSHLGQCANFEVKTYVYSGRRKTYIMMSGCQPELGCTIILRGANMETLRRIKRIAEFMSYVVYNLRLETCLMRDEFVLIPQVSSLKVPAASKLKPVPGQSVEGSVSNSAPVTPAPDAGDADPMEAAAAAGPGDSEAKRAAAQPNTLNHLVDAAEHKEMTSGQQQASTVPEEDSMPSEYRELMEIARTRLISSSPFVKFPEPYLLIKVQDQERKVERSKRLRDKYDYYTSESDVDPDATPLAEQKPQLKKEYEFEIVKPEMIDQDDPEQQPRAVRQFLRSMHDAQYQKASYEYEIKKRQWESFFMSSNNNPFNPFSHQNIFVLHSLVSSVTSVPCAGPEVVGLGFYAGAGHAEPGLEDDCTLGQFIEDVCAGANTTCKTCSRKMVDHHRQYVHGHGQVSVSVTRYPPKYKHLQHTIFMWSTCKVCQAETTWIPMSDNSWKYSLGKYLELSFWSTPLKPRAGVCPHDIHKDFVRCFAFQGLAVRVQYDNIELYDVLVPTSFINWEVTPGLSMKNQLFNTHQKRLDAFIESVKKRLGSIHLDTVAPEKRADATATREKLNLRADADHRELLKQLQQSYIESEFYEVIPMNRAVRMMDERAIAWDEAFADFERNFFPSENDIRRLATLQLKKFFSDRVEAQTQAEEEEDAQEGQGQEKIPSDEEGESGIPMRPRRRPTMNLTDEELQSEKAQNMLSAVVEEHGHVGTGAQPAVPVTGSLPNNTADLHDAAGMTRQLLPNEIEQAVKREDVKHLDLAVPISLLPEDARLSGAESTSVGKESIVSHGDADGRERSEEFVADPKPLNSTILERIEQMRSAAAPISPGLGTELPLPESRIPRLTNLRARGPNSPPMVRTQSQPSQVPRRSGDFSSDLPVIESVASGDNSGTATPTQVSAPPRDLAKTIEQRLVDRLGTGRRAQASLIPRSVPNKSIDNSTRVSALAKHFEQLSREFERERLRERRLRAARSRQVRANPLASSRPVVEVYRDAREAVGEKADDLRISTDLPSSEHPGIDGHDHAEVSPEQLQDSHHEDDATDHYVTDTELGGSTVGGQTDTEAEGDATDAEDSNVIVDKRKRETSDPSSSHDSTTLPSSPASTHDIEPHLDISLPKHERSSLMKMLTSFWSERTASGWLPLEYPLLPTEHVFDDSDIIVREDEPASVIALALSSADYVTKLYEFRGNPSRGRQYPMSHVQHSHSGSMSSSFSFPQQFSSTADAGAQAAIEASLISETGTHMKYSFAHGPVKATCKIFYAESFDALRRKCGVSDRFVESLSRCAKWDSKGGKTKSLFLKTLDDRFVIKSLQEVELKAFTKFAPDYFAFMSHTLFHGVPSVIAKMFGLFQVIIKNPSTGTEFSSYLLVMENLFYSRNPTRRFDLKGSMRNRKIESTGQPDEVLLDENLVETIFETPLFVREHARKLLKASVWNDTMWLCKQNVMDYSLMAGFDDERKELVVGIIDCIRTYTWDKKLESWIKDRGRNKPTITSPRDYRNRFRVSMMQYVLQAPNVWHGFLSAGSEGATHIFQPNQLDLQASEQPGGQINSNEASRNVSASLGGGTMDSARLREQLLAHGGTLGKISEGVKAGLEQNDEDEVVGEGHLSTEATIREMDTMTFA